ncbi:helix-turn-helix domain-containing protein [bacterium]|nr:helix-turn-helix domain-containing protein [bacterium]MBV5348843.1 helix-turn-helix domain-containing protein [bacterium]
MKLEIFNSEGLKVEQNFILKSEDLMKAVDQLADYKFELMKQAEKAKGEKSDSEFLLSGAACEILKISRATLERWKKSEYLVPVKAGGKCLYRRADIERILNVK